jgi:hypothetical protein
MIWVQINLLNAGNQKCNAPLLVACRQEDGRYGQIILHNMPGFGYRVSYFVLLSSENQLIANWALRFLAQEASSCPIAMGRSSP